MNDNWIVHPPLRDDQWPPVPPGFSVEKDFNILKNATTTDLMTSFFWTGLSRQEASALNNLSRSVALQELLRPYEYGSSMGAEIDLSDKPDPNDASCDLAIYSKEDIPPAILTEIMDFIRAYRVP